MNESIITKEMLDALELGREIDETYVAAVNRLLNQRVGAMIGESLDTERLKQLTEISRSGNAAKIRGFIDANVPDASEIAMNATEILLSDLVEVKGDLDKVKELETSRK